MRTQDYLDSIKTIFPEAKDTQILKDIDKSQKLFSTETGLLTALGSLASISTNFAWTLPSNFRRLIDVKMYDVNGLPLYFGDSGLMINYEIQLGKFYIYSLTSTPIDAFPSSVSSVYLFYECLPTTILTQDTALEIEEEFRDAIEHDVLRKYFAKYPVDTIAQGQVIKARDWNAVKYHDACYKELRVKAKIYLNSKETTLGDYINYQHAGKQRLPLREYDSSYSSTTIGTITAVGTIYSDFVLYNISTTDSGTITEAIQTGFATISASKTGATLTLTSTAEFTNDIFIESNNWETSWVVDNTSQITITLPASFTALSIQIYKFL
jgi:hypothetical protein